MEEKTWFGLIPEQCELCSKKLDRIFIDGKIRNQAWAIMCVSCHFEHGIGFGVGCGQKYSKNAKLEDCNGSFNDRI